MIDTAPNSRPAPSRWSRYRLVAAIIAYVVLLSIGFYNSSRLPETLGLEPGDNALIVNDGAIWLSISAYAMLLAIPFVPGIEISLGLLATFGSTIALQVYLATVAAFVLSFAIGRIVPPGLLSGFFRSVGLTSAEELVERLRPLSQKERLALLIGRAPRRFVPTLLRYRYVALVLAFNLPGNAILGGGGGIALLAGLSGLFSCLPYIIAVCIAAVPVPLAVLLIGRVF